MRVQALIMLDAQPEIEDIVARAQGLFYLARGILAEHWVHAVLECERLLVLALDCRLHWCFERVLCQVNEINDAELVIVAFKPHEQACEAALTVRRGVDALLTPKPRAHFAEAGPRLAAEVLLKLLLNELARERGAARAGRRIEDAEAELDVHLPFGEGTLDGDGIGVPARVVGYERGPAHKVIEIELNEGARA